MRRPSRTLLHNGPGGRILRSDHLCADRRSDVNDLGEVGYSGHDIYGRQQIHSNVRDQLTFYDGDTSFVSADLPDIDSLGKVDFRASVDHRTGIYRLNMLAPSGVLLPLSGLAMVTWLRRPRPPGVLRR